MLTHSKDQITTSQMTVIVINYIVAAGVLTLPRAIVQKIHSPDAWIDILIGGGIALLAGFIIVKLALSFPGKTIYEYSQQVLGTYLGYLLSVLLIVHFIMISAFELRTMEEVTSYFLIEGTPPSVIIMTMLWVGLYLIQGGINAIARLGELILPLSIGIFILVLLMSKSLFELDNLRPVLGQGVMPVLKGVKTTALSFTGTEVMLILMVYMRRQEKAMKSMVTGITIPIVIYLLAVIMVIGGLSVEGTEMRVWPTLDLVRSYEISGLVFERFESLLLGVWILQIFFTYIISYYCASIGVSKLLNRTYKFSNYALLPLIYLVSMVPKTINDLFALGDVIGNDVIMLFGIVPVCMLLLSRWRKSSL